MKWAFVVALASLLLLSYLHAQEQESVEGPPPQNTARDETYDVQLGTPVHAPNPRVPKSLRHDKGCVVLGATLKTDGTFNAVSALTGDHDFAAAAIETLREWKYAPATLNNAPVDADVFIIFSYDHGKVQSMLRPNPPFPTKPQVSLEELKTRGDLFTVVNPKVMKVPKAIYSPDPEYSETARIAKFQGTCVVSLILAKDGTVEDAWITRKLGLGLEQKALETVRRWKFDPAMKDGEPVAVFINVEVAFHLY